MKLLLHVTQCIGWIVSRKLDTYLIFLAAVNNFYRRMGFKHDPTMLTWNDLEPLCIIFYLTNLTNLDEINPISIKVKAIKLKVDKLHGGRWCFIVPHDKAVITKSRPPKNIFPHNIVSKYIDDDMNITGELIGRYSCEK